MDPYFTAIPLAEYKNKLPFAHHDITEVFKVEEAVAVIGHFPFEKPMAY